MALAVSVLVAAAVLVAVTPGSPPAEPLVRPASTRPVTGVDLACADSSLPPRGVRTSYGVALAPLPEATDGGRLSLLSQDVPGPGRGETTVTGPPSKSAVFVVEASGASAPGVFSWRVDHGPTLAVIGCESPRASWWFAGAGAALDHRSTLSLYNLDAGPAVVDIRALSPDGEVDLDQSGGRGLIVAPGETRTVPLVSLAPESDDVALWVHATRGRIVAAVKDEFAARPGAASGRDWLTSQTTPLRSLWLAGVGPSRTTRTLVVANPSGLESLVSIELAGPQGRFVPATSRQTSVGPGEVATFDLSEALRGEAVSVRVQASRAVVAALRSSTAKDVAYAGYAAVLNGPAGAPVLPGSAVQLTAPGLDAQARVSAYTSDGTGLRSSEVAVPARTTRTIALPSRAAYVVVEPVSRAGRHGVLGAVVFGGGTASLALRELPVTVQVPVVEPAW